VKIVFKFILTIVLITSNIVVSQENIPLFDLRNEKYQSSLEKFYQSRSIIRTISPQVLEDELEAENYVVGPGDQFKANIFGEMEEEFEFTILPEGKILIPTVGEFDIKGKTLEEAKEIIYNEIKKYYIKGDISVNLIGLRKFRVYLTGDVVNPGTFFAQASDRLSDIIEVAGMANRPITQTESGIQSSSGLNDWADDTRIEIRHQDGSTDTVDLTKYYRLGEKGQNPYLKGGDVIFAPSIDLGSDYVIIEGNVGFQGVYSLIHDETLFEFLRRVSAINKRSNLENIILVRDGKKEMIDILNDQEKYKNSKLVNRDKIIIPSLYDKVYVRGEVYLPGALPYLANYRSRDYIGKAGALDSAVDESKIIIVRQKTGEILKGGNIIIEKGDTIIVPKRAREVFKDYMAILTPIISLAIATVALVSK